MSAIRPYLMKLALSLFLLAACTAIGAETGKLTSPVGLQLYSLRDAFKTDVPGTLDKVKALGFTEVEVAGLNGLTAEAFRKLLDDRGLKAISGHWQYDRLVNETEAVAAEAKTLGCSYVVCPWIPHSGALFNEGACHRAAEDFNKVGEAMKKHGLQFCYHPHGYEFAPHGDGTYFDLMVKETNPEFVNFQMDVFWIVHPGKDPVKLMETYPTRFKLMHLKEMQKGTPTGVLNAKAPKDSSVALGTGMMNWPAIFQEAQKIGIQHYFIEDESSKVEEQLPVTLKYLKTLTW